MAIRQLKTDTQGKSIQIKNIVIKIKPKHIVDKL